MSRLFTVALLAVLSLLILPAKAYNNVSFFVVAHQDDWQLFMGENAYNEVQNPNGKVVFIYTTAGNYKENTPPFAYTEARQQGAINSAMLAANANNLPYAPPVSGTRVFNGKTIQYFKYKNTISYFLRLADGDVAQPGLNALMAFTAPANSIGLPAATYKNWNDLIGTLSAIYSYESSGISTRWLNCADPSYSINPGDHKDHMTTSSAAQQAASGLICNKVFYVEYYSNKLNKNVGNDGLINKTGLLAVYTHAMNQNGFFATSSWDSAHKSWLDKTYFRIVPCTEGLTAGNGTGGRPVEGSGVVLDQNYPNPFRESTTIAYEIPQDGFVNLKIMDSVGGIIKTLVNADVKAGKYKIELKRSDLTQSNFYYCTLEALGTVQSIRIMPENNSY